MGETRVAGWHPSILHCRHDGGLCSVLSQTGWRMVGRWGRLHGDGMDDL